MIKQKIKADYVANSAVINEAAQIITVKKLITFPHSNDKALKPSSTFKYKITEKKNNIYYLISVSNVNIETEDTIWTMEKGEIATYEINNAKDEKTEKWTTISY